MTKTRFPFFDYPYGEWYTFNTDTPIGLYMFRYVEYLKLLESSQSNTFRHKEYVTDPVFHQDSNLHLMKPLGEIIIAMQMVAYEDYLRQQFKYLIESPDIRKLYNFTDSSFSKKKYGDYIDFAKLSDFNNEFAKSFGFMPIEDRSIPQLEDLVNVRNIVFHFGGVITKRKRDKFKFYEVGDNVRIEPNYDGAKNISEFIYEQAKYTDKTLSRNILKKIRDNANKDWKTKPPKLMIDTIRHFCYFGHLAEIEPGITVGVPDEEHRKLFEKKLLDKCFDEVSSF